MGFNSSTSARIMAVTSAARIPCPVTSQIKTAGLVLRQRGNAEEIAADGFRRLITVNESQGALFGRGVVGEGGILLGQHGELDFARHVEVFLHQQVLGAQFLAAAGQFGVRAADLFLGEFSAP